MVPTDARTIDKAKVLMTMLGQVKTYTPEAPLVVLLGPGEHVISSQWKSTFSDSIHLNTIDIPFNNITIQGAGLAATTVHGGLVVENKSGIQLKKFATRSHSYMGLYMKGEYASARAEDCSFNHCKYAGIFMIQGASLVATRCQVAWNEKQGVFAMNQGTSIVATDCSGHNNATEGLLMYDSAVAHLYGEKTKFHNNKNGLSASEDGTVQLHIAKEHNSSCDNSGSDRVVNDKLVGTYAGKIKDCSTCPHCVHRYPHL